MSDIAKHRGLNQINDLFQQAEEEENKYDWEKEIEILKEIGKITFSKKLEESEAKVYYKLGEIYLIAAEFEKTRDKVLNCLQLCLESFQKAHNLFKQLNNEEKINATLGFINYMKYLIESEKGNKLILLESSENYFSKARQMNQNKENLIDSLKIQIFEHRVLVFSSIEKVMRIDENTDFKELASENEILVRKIWDGINKPLDIPEIYIYWFINNNYILSFVYEVYLPINIYNPAQFSTENVNKCKKFIEKITDTNKTLSMLNATLACSMFYTIGLFYEDQFEQKKCFKKAKKWIEKAEQLLLKNNLNCQTIIMHLHYLIFINSCSLLSVGLLTEDFKFIFSHLNGFLNLVNLSPFKMVIIPWILYTVVMLGIGALDSSISYNQRIGFVEKALDICEIAKTLMSEEDFLKYKFLKLEIDGFICKHNAILGILVENKEQRAEYLQISARIFEEIPDYPKQIDNTVIYTDFLMYTSYAGRLLARTSLKEPEKVRYYQKVISLLLKRNKMMQPAIRIESLFSEGDSYFELGLLTKDEKILKKSYSSYVDTIEYCKNKGYLNLIGSAYVNLAVLDDRLGNYLSAAENYQKAIDSFNQAISNLKYTHLSNKIEKLKNYISAWKIIEIAKSFHVKEEHHEAQLNYQEASSILKNIREYKYESRYYFAWATLEYAEDLSKKNKHEEAAVTYLTSKNNFGEAIEILTSYLRKKMAPEAEERISKLIQVAKIREKYCDARYQIETARLESKKGNHLAAAGLYNKSGLLFENLLHTYKIEREKGELTAVYYLCKVWENMELADGEKKSEFYAIAAELFKRAGDTFNENRMKSLSLGNSLYCSALERGSLFDKSSDLEEKLKLYKQIKMFLIDSSKNYQLGDFKQDAQWALATSTFFDGIWNLIQSNNEIDLSKKNQYLSLATNYLNNALEIFEKAGYEQKKEDILKYLEMIKNEKAIIVSALNIIEKPTISASSVGISAPFCPIEISSSVNIKDMERTDLQAESELNWRKRIHSIIFFIQNGTCIYDYNFKEKEGLSSSLIAGGLMGLFGLIQEITASEKKIKIIEQEDMTILLEHGKYIIVALITEENLITLRNKLIELVKVVEEYFWEKLGEFSGNITPFLEMRKFVQKIFEEHTFGYL